MVELAPRRRRSSSGRPAAALALCAVSLSLWACPGDLPGGKGGSAGNSGSGGGSADTPASERRLDELSRSELQSYCSDLNLELSTRFGNRRLALYACTRMYIHQPDTLTCNRLTNTCLLDSMQASLAAPRPPDYQISNDECAAIGTCKLELREVDACIGERFDQSDQLMAKVNCSLARDPPAVDQLLQQIDSGPSLPDSCASVVATCPWLL
jgi:hypothetical protein